MVEVLEDVHLGEEPVFLFFDDTAFLDRLHRSHHPRAFVDHLRDLSERAWGNRVR